MPYTVGRYGRYGMAYSMRHIAILLTYIGRMLYAILASNSGRDRLGLHLCYGSQRLIRCPRVWPAPHAHMR